MLKFEFPIELPKDDPVTLWKLQQHLIVEAESRFGARDNNKIVYQPIFREDGPIIINTPNLDGAFAALSPNAAGYWPTAAYELAHETLHLLNPTVGLTNWLEEGIAVAFSIAMSQYTDHPMAPPKNSNYSIALEMVESLPTSYEETARRVRSECGSLSGAKISSLVRIFPSSDIALLNRLAELYVYG